MGAPHPTQDVAIARPAAPPADPATALQDHPSPQTEHPAAALADAQARLDAAPGDDDAFRALIFALADLGASALAAEHLAQRPHLFADHERERLEGDAIARRIGWARIPAAPDTPRLAASRAALDALETLQANAPRQTRWERTRLQIDALDALNHLQRHQEVVDGYTHLVEAGIDVPAYILPAVGDSLLALRRPEDAVAVLETALRHRPDDVNTRILLAYAWLESERFDLALPAFQAIADSQPAWPRRTDAETGYENWDRFDADLNLALAHSYANDHAQAERLLASHLGIGPGNTALQTAFGAVQSRRSRPAAALERYRMALTRDPESRDALAGQVDALTALDRIGAARDALTHLQRLHPEDPRTPRVARSLERHRGPQLALTYARGRNSAPGQNTAASPLGSRDGGRRLEARSSLIADRWRVGVVAGDDWADFEDGRIRHRGAGVGGWYRHDRLSAAATVSRIDDRSRHGSTAWTAEADWRFSDAWRGGVRVARQDPEASLQARRAGVTADSLGVSARWTPHDLVTVGASAARLRYDDGNRRDQFALDARRRLLTRPHLWVDALGSTYASRGSLGEQATYFNPERDVSAQAGLGIEHIVWRRYETALRQRLELTAGRYRQRGFGTALVPAIGYRHRWQRESGSLEYGVAWSRPVYDGVREHRVVVDAALHWGGAP